MFYTITNQRAVERKLTPEELATLEFPKTVSYAMEGRWFVVSPSTGAWCLLDEKEHRAYRTILEDAVHRQFLYEKQQTREWQFFLSRLVECGLAYMPQAGLPSPQRNRPFRLTLILSDNCGLACRYCYLNAKTMVNGAHIQSEEGKTLIRQTLQLPVGRILIDFGEIATSYLLFRELVLFAEDYNKHYTRKDLSFAIQTNGAWSASWIFDFLEEHRITVGVSLDGPRAQNDQVRFLRSGIGSHQSAERALREIIRRNISHIVLCTICSVNVAKASEILDYFFNLGALHFSFKPIIRRGKAQAEWALLGISPHEFSRFIDQVVDFAIEKRNWNALDQQIIKFTYRLLRDQRGWSDGCPTFDCGLGVEMLTATPRGDLYPCPRFSTLEQNHFTLGRDFSSAIQTAARLQNEKHQLTGQCKTCSWLAYCKGGCPLARSNLGAETSDPNCVVYQHMYQMILSKILPRINDFIPIPVRKIGAVQVVNEQFFVRTNV